MFEGPLDSIRLQMHGRQCRQVAQRVKDESIRERLITMATEYEERASFRRRKEVSDRNLSPLINAIRAWGAR
jgi:hypothetical protein